MIFPGQPTQSNFHFLAPKLAKCFYSTLFKGKTTIITPNLGEPFSELATQLLFPFNSIYMPPATPSSLNRPHSQIPIALWTLIFDGE